MNCKECIELMPDLARNLLDAQQAATIGAHLEECEHCAQTYQELYQALRLIFTLKPIEAVEWEAPWQGATAQGEAELAAVEKPGPPPQPQPWWQRTFQRLTSFFEQHPMRTLSYASMLIVFGLSMIYLLHNELGSSANRHIQILGVDPDPSRNNATRSGSDALGLIGADARQLDSRLYSLALLFDRSGQTVACGVMVSLDARVLLLAPADLAVVTSAAVIHKTAAGKVALAPLAWPLPVLARDATFGLSVFDLPELAGSRSAMLPDDEWLAGLVAGGEKMLDVMALEDRTASSTLKIELRKTSVNIDAQGGIRPVAPGALKGLIPGTGAFDEHDFFLVGMFLARTGQAVDFVVTKTIIEKMLKNMPPKR